MAQIKKLSDVKVGSIIKLGGVSYRVSNNFINDLQVVSSAGEVKASTIVPGLGHNSLITVFAEPAAIRGEVKTSLTDQLKGQLSKPTGSAFAELKTTSTIDTKARFEAQLAKVAAQQAHAVADEAVSRIEDVEDSLIHAHDRIDIATGDIDVALEGVHDVKQSLATFSGLALTKSDNLSQRVSKLESKEVARNTQAQLQASLNAKLAEQKIQPQLGGNKMSKLTQSFKGLFGKVEGQFAIAATGSIAMRNGISENYVVYDANTGSITDVQSLVLDFNVPAFRLPVEAKDVKVGNIIVNDGNYGYVKQVADGYVRVVFPTKNTEGTVIPTSNLFLQKPFYTVVQTLDIAGQSGFNPALLLAMGDGKKDDILPFLLMSGGLGGQAQSGAIDPTLLMMLGDNMDDLLPFLLLQQGGLTQQGFNPLMLLAMQGKGGKGSKDSLLPLLLMQGQNGGAQGGFNPMMLLAMGDGDIDPMTLMLMSGGFGGQNAFGGQPATVQGPATAEARTENNSGK